MQRDTNFKHEKSRVGTGSFFLFLQIYDFYRWGKTGQIDFLEKPDPTNAKHFVTSLPSLMEFHRMERKRIHSQFCFLCPCWHKISKTIQVFLWKYTDSLEEHNHVFAHIFLAIKTVKFICDIISIFAFSVSIILMHYIFISTCPNLRN